jgi:small-conductance mechanosensitive channel
MENIFSWSLEIMRVYGWRIFWIVVLFIGGRWAINFLARKIRILKEKHLEQHPESNLARRAGTFESGIILVARIVLYSVILLMVLDLFQVETGPLLTGLGITGLVVGLGTQQIIRNLMAGLLFMVEDPFDIGDEITIKKCRGKVVKITLSSVVLQGEEGEMIYFPNGDIKEIINHTQQKHFSASKKNS